VISEKAIAPGTDCMVLEDIKAVGFPGGTKMLAQMLSEINKVVEKK